MSSSTAPRLFGSSELNQNSSGNNRAESAAITETVPRSDILLTQKANNRGISIQGIVPSRFDNQVPDSPGTSGSGVNQSTIPKFPADGLNRAEIVTKHHEAGKEGTAKIKEDSLEGHMDYNPSKNLGNIERVLKPKEPKANPAQQYGLPITESNASLVTKAGILRDSFYEPPWSPFSRDTDYTSGTRGFAPDTDIILPVSIIQGQRSSIEPVASPISTVNSFWGFSKKSSGDTSSKTFSSIESEAGVPSVRDCFDSDTGTEDQKGHRLDDNIPRSHAGFVGHDTSSLAFRPSPPLGWDNLLFSTEYTYQSRSFPGNHTSPSACVMSSASSTHLGETVEDEQELLLGQHQNLATDPSISKFANNSSQNTQPITNTSPASEATTDVSTSDTTEWEDDSDTETEYGHGELTVSDTYKHLDIMRSILLPERTNLVNRIMQEFWIIFYQDWATKFRKCGTNTSSTPSTTRECRIADQSAPSSGPQKHQREDDDPLPPDDRQGRDQKRPRYGSVVSGLIDDSMRLACPYRKHDPRRYSVQLWQSCALTSHDTVARVKAHLYKYHWVHQCPRCKDCFNTRKDLDSHIVAANACEPQDPRSVEGVTDEVKKHLQSRKKSYPGQSDAERWKEIYHVLFPSVPNEAIPSPYFEPVPDHHDHTVQSPSSLEIANYEEFLRRELPRTVRSLLEEAMTDELEPIEERMRSQLINMVKEAHERVSYHYRATLGSGADSTPAAARHEQLMEPDINQAQEFGSVSAAVFETFYQPPPVQPHLSSAFQPSIFSNQDKGNEEDDPSDSGYFSTTSATANPYEEDNAFDYPQTSWDRDSHNVADALTRPWEHSQATATPQGTFNEEHGNAVDSSSHPNIENGESRHADTSLPIPRYTEFEQVDWQAFFDANYSENPANTSAHGGPTQPDFG